MPFCNRLKVFYLHLESPSDQENTNGFAVERFWLLGHRVLMALDYKPALLKEMFEEPPLISYKKGSSLQDILVRAKL